VVLVLLVLMVRLVLVVLVVLVLVRASAAQVERLRERRLAQSQLRVHDRLACFVGQRHGDRAILPDGDRDVG